MMVIRVKRVIEISNEYVEGCVRCARCLPPWLLKLLQMQLE